MEEERALHRRDTMNSPLIKRLDLCKSLFTYTRCTKYKIHASNSYLYRSLGLIPSFSSMSKTGLIVSVRIQLIACHLTHISLL